MRYGRVLGIAVAVALFLSSGTALTLAQGSKATRPAPVTLPSTPLEKLQQLSQLDPVRVRNAAAGYLNHADPAVRTLAAQLLGKYGSPQQVAPLYALAESDPDAKVQEEAELSATQIQVRALSGNPKATVAMLRKPLKSKSTEVRRLAAQTLRGMPDKEALALREEAAKTEPDASIQQILRTK